MSLIVRMPACSHVTLIIVSEVGYCHVCDILESADNDCAADIVIEVRVGIRSHAKNRNIFSVISLYTIQEVNVIVTEIYLERLLSCREIVCSEIDHYHVRSICSH